MPLISSEDKLVKEIVNIIKSKSGSGNMVVKAPQSDDSGKTSEKKNAVSSGKGNVSAKTKKNPKTGAGISLNDVTGAEALAAVIADRVINHILTEFQLAAKARYDKLETDYNNLLAQLQIVAAAALPNPMTAAVGIALQAAVIAAGGPARAGITAGLKAKEKAKAKGGELL